MTNPDPPAPTAAPAPGPSPDPRGPVRRRIPLGTAPERLDQALARWCGLSRTRARAVIAAGGAWVDGARVRIASREVREGQEIEAWAEAWQHARAAAEAEGPRITWQDRWLVAVSKPAGMPSQPTRAAEAGTVLAYLQARFGPRVHLPHRLDTAASGLLVAAHHPAAADPLQRLFTERRIVRIYRVVVEGSPPAAEGEVHHLLVEEGGRRRAVAVPGDEVTAPTGRGRPSLRTPGPGPAAAARMALRYRLMEAEDGRSLLQVRLLTGRTHQIRLQMAALGCPVVGDAVYGGAAPGSRLGLHASELTFRHPMEGGRVDLADPPGPDFPWPRPAGLEREAAAPPPLSR